MSRIPNDLSSGGRVQATRCPGCRKPIIKTLDENSGDMRYRCEKCDLEECQHCSTTGSPVFVHYFMRGEQEEHGWAHIDARECFLNGPAPWPYGEERR